MLDLSIRSVGRNKHAQCTRVLHEGIDIHYKDFDTVPHTQILMKLCNYGIVKQTIALITAFLSNRDMRETVRQQALRLQHGS